MDRYPFELFIPEIVTTSDPLTSMMIVAKKTWLCLGDKNWTTTHQLGFNKKLSESVYCHIELGGDIQLKCGPTESVINKSGLWGPEEPEEPLGWMMKLLIWQEVTQYWVGSSHYPIQLSNDHPLSSTRDTLQWNLIPIVKRQLTVDSSPSASEVCLSDTSPCVCLAAWVQRQQLHFAFHVDRFKDICQRRLQWQSFFSFELRIRFN